MRIDLNADLGEGFGPWRMGDDEALLDLVSSANIACGFHAGDPLIMQRSVAAAAERGVDIGAHVGFPDRQGFGRRPMQIDDEDLAAMVTYQLGALAGFTRSVGRPLSHMSFHGALGNMVAANATMARSLLAAVKRFDPNLIVLTSTSEAIEGVCAELGLHATITFLADRAYDSNRLLVPRRLPGSVIHDRNAVLARVERLLADGTAVTHDGGSVQMSADSILLHGDTPGAVELATAIRNQIQESGGTVIPVSRLVSERPNT